MEKERKKIDGGLASPGFLTAAVKMGSNGIVKKIMSCSANISSHYCYCLFTILRNILHDTF